MDFIYEFMLLYTILFLLALIEFFIRGRGQTERGRDELLGRNVDKIVILQNQRLLKATFLNELEQNELQRQGVKALAEANEYIYKQLKEHGIGVKLVPSITTAFIDVTQELDSESDNVHFSESLSERQSGLRFNSKNDQLIESFDTEDDRSRHVREEIEKFQEMFDAGGGSFKNDS